MDRAWRRPPRGSTRRSGPGRRPAAALGARGLGPASRRGAGSGDTLRPGLRHGRPLRLRLGARTRRSSLGSHPRRFDGMDGDGLEANLRGPGPTRGERHLGAGGCRRHALGGDREPGPGAAPPLGARLLRPGRRHGRRPRFEPFRGLRRRAVRRHLVEGPAAVGRRALSRRDSAGAGGSRPARVGLEPARPARPSGALVVSHRGGALSISSRERCRRSREGPAGGAFPGRPRPAGRQRLSHLRGPRGGRLGVDDLDASP